MFYLLIGGFIISLGFIYLLRLIARPTYLFYPRLIGLGISFDFYIILEAFSFMFF